MSEERDVSAFPVKEFCRRNSISTAKYAELGKLGRGPREMRLGGKILISIEAEQAWKHARENPVGEEAAEIEAAARRFKERSARAVAGTQRYRNAHG